MIMRVCFLFLIKIKVLNRAVANAIWLSNIFPDITKVVISGIFSLNYVARSSLLKTPRVVLSAVLLVEL